MQPTAGMGATGETCLVGEDKLMRSRPRFTTEPSTLSIVVDTRTARRALAGFEGNGRAIAQ